MKNFIEDVYYSLTGDLIDPIEGVEDAFDEGTLCAKISLYQGYPSLRRVPQGVAFSL